MTHTENPEQEERAPSEPPSYSNDSLVISLDTLDLTEISRQLLDEEARSTKSEQSDE